jgi:hypothetical protein
VSGVKILSVSGNGWWGSATPGGDPKAAAELGDDKRHFWLPRASSPSSGRPLSPPDMVQQQGTKVVRQSSLTRLGSMINTAVHKKTSKYTLH